MYKYLTIAAVMLITATAAAQPADKEKYCYLRICSPFPMIKRSIAKVNYNTGPDSRYEVLKDKDGHRMKFNSEQDVLVYFLNNGWDVVTSYHHGGTEFIIKRKT